MVGFHVKLSCSNVVMTLSHPAKYQIDPIEQHKWSEWEFVRVAFDKTSFKVLFSVALSSKEIA